MVDASDEFGVLVVDDDSAMADLTVTHLTRLLTEATVEAENDPQTALTRIESERIGCIVSDYDMPEWTGLDLLDRVRRHDPEVPFILFTGKGSEEIASDAISAGVTDYLQKRTGSDRFEVLANRIRNAVSRQWAVREAERLQRITDVIRTTQRGLVSASTPVEVCEGVCQSLTETATYEGVWLGDYDPDSGAVRLSGSAGAVGVPGDDFPSDNPVRLTGAERRAIHDCVVGRETRIVSCSPPGDIAAPNEQRAVTKDDIPPEYELLVVPLVHDNDLFGFLAVYAHCGYEFGETEADVLIELSWTVAQAISATRTRQTLVERERTLTRYETLLEVLGDPVYALDRTGHLTYVNEAFEGITGYSEAELLGEHPSMLVDDETISLLQTDIESLLADPNRHRSIREIDVRTKSGGAVRCEDNIALLPDLCDGFRGTVGVVRDIEERVATERRLRENSAKIEEIHGFARDVVNCETVDAVCERTVAAADRILDFDVCYVGLRDGEYIVPRALRNVANPQTVRCDDSVAGQVIRSGVSHLTGDIPSDPKANPTDEAYRSGMTVPISDFGVFQAGSFRMHDFDESDLELAELLLSHVTEALKRVHYESKLRDERDRVTALFENLPEPAAACHATSGGPVVDDVNNEFERVFGYDYAEIVGENIDDHVIPADDEAITLEETYYVGTTVQTAVKRRTKRGVRDFLVTIIPVELGGYSSEGYVIYADISEQKRRERKLCQQNERLAEFTSLVTHDLRNPLNVAMGNLELGKESEDFERLDTALAALDRMEALIGDFLSLAKQGRTVSDPTTLALEPVATQAWRTVDTGPKATLDVVDDIGTISADPERLRTVFENFFRNAVEHGDETTSIRLGRLADAPDGFYVEDDGPGIDPETRENVFEYGYSTGDGGTGFGLAIVKRIVRAHDWTIAVAEAESGGARFEIRTK